MQIHPRFEILQLRTSIQYALQRHFELRLEEERYVRMQREVVDAAHPFRRTTPHDIPCECGKNVSIAKHDVARAQQGNELPLVAVSKVGGMNQTEGRWREQFAFFAFAGCALHQCG